MTSFSDVIARFGYTEFSRIVGRSTGTVSSWQSRNHLPPEYWAVTVREAEARGFSEITHQALAAMAEARASQLARARSERAKTLAPAAEQAA